MNKHLLSFKKYNNEAPKIQDEGEGILWYKNNKLEEL
jgi:hypothetical protein